MKEFNAADIEKQIGYTFKNKDLLLQAFTHSSYSNENDAHSYERLEFLGDSILGFVVAEELYLRFPDIDEGQLTTKRAELVSGKALSKIVQSLNLMEYIRVGKGSIKETRISNKVQCDLFESIAGAILIDSNWNRAACKEYILRFLEESIRGITQKSIGDYKSKLKELCDKKRQEVVYDYTKENDDGFTARVFIDQKEVAEGYGKAKIEAAQKAAKSYFDNK